MIKIPTRQIWLDRALAATCCALATFAGGMSIFNLNLAIFFAVSIVLANVFGGLLARAVRGTKLEQYDGWIMASVILVVVLQSWPLNSLLPSGGYPWNLLVVGTLSWALVFGSVVAWRDGSLMFLTLPCIAIFGLVGVFDTWGPAVATFFLFLSLGAILYGRIHHRYMIECARESGFVDTAILRRGAWRWMAGPEWALGAAGAIVLISLIGAPILQDTLEDVSPQIDIRLPEPTPEQTEEPTVQMELEVGNGPNPLTDRAVFNVRMDDGRYLRKQAFSGYDGRGWQREELELTDQAQQEVRMLATETRETADNDTMVWPANETTPAEPIDPYQLIEVTIAIESGLHSDLYLPGPVFAVPLDLERYRFTIDGLVRMPAQLRPGDVARAYAYIPPDGATSTNADLPTALRPSRSLFMSYENVPTRVVELARQVTEGADNDWGKAMAIKREIERRVKYNINTPAIPSDVDACEYVLFESQEGYCDVFATSMALMARAAGMPSRVSIGYAINDGKRDADGYFTVRERDYHAWAEIYFEDIGWTPFDPTEGAEEVPGSGVGDSNGMRPWYQQGWFLMLVNALIALLALALVAFLVVLSKPSWRINQRTARWELAKQLGAFHASVERRLRHPKRFSHTTQEFIALAGAELGELRDEAKQIANEFDRLMFGSKRPDSDRVLALARQVAAFRAALRRAPRSAA